MNHKELKEHESYVREYQPFVNRKAKRKSEQELKHRNKCSYNHSCEYGICDECPVLSSREEE